MSLASNNNEEQQKEEQEKYRNMKSEVEIKSPLDCSVPTRQLKPNNESSATPEKLLSSTCSSEVQSEPAMDNLFEEFMSEVGTLPSSNDKPKKIQYLPSFLFDNSRGNVCITEEHDGSTSSSVMSDVPLKIQFSTADDECERLTSKTFTNLFEVLRLPTSASEEDIKKAYKKISLLIHPDKCKHLKAAEAFDVANKAYEELQKPEMKDKYKLVVSEARKRVLKVIEKENRKRTRRGEELLSSKDEDIQIQIGEMCDTLLKQIQENLQYAEKCRKANEEWEQMAEEQLLEEARKNEETKRKWADTRDNRVGDWKEFKEEIKSKKIKVANFVPVTHRREQRLTKEKGGLKKPMGIDESYKQNWR